jgi:hypothetical protein
MNSDGPVFRCEVARIGNPIAKQRSSKHSPTIAPADFETCMHRLLTEAVTSGPITDMDRSKVCKRLAARPGTAAPLDSSRKGHLAQASHKGGDIAVLEMARRFEDLALLALCCDMPARGQEFLFKFLP